jgi:hypothetical protein
VHAVLDADKVVRIGAGTNRPLVDHAQHLMFKLTGKVKAQRINP